TLLLLVGVVGAKAQKDTTVLELDLKGALEIALSDNPTIKVAGMEIKRQDYVRRETRGGLYPQISASGSYNYNIMNPVMFMPEGLFGPGSGGAMRMGFSNGIVGGVSVSIPLYMPTIYKMLQLNEKQMMLAVEAARSTKITLSNQVKKSYYAVLLGQSSLGVINKNIETAKVVVTNAQNALSQGVASEYDLITAQVQLSNLYPVLLTAENGLRVSRLMLNMLLSVALETEVRPTETLETYASFAQQDSIYGVDLTGNSDLTTLDIQKEILGKQLKVQQMLRVPTLSAMGQYQVQSQNNTLRLGTYDWRGSALAGLQLSIPIFSGLSKLNKERQIKNSISQMAIQRDYLEQSVSVEAQAAISSMTSAQGRMKANLEAKTQADKSYKISKTRYDTGAGTIVEVNSAQAALLQAELNFTQSIFDFMSARADLDKVVGEYQIQ
ncbi:MAG: TolC family protein, partial [Mucinivorans sp.]